MPTENLASRNALFGQQVIERVLAAGCVGFVVSPGSRNTPLVMAVTNASVPVKVVLDERSAGFFALGWAKAAKAPVALICTSGSAGAHYLPAIIEAWESGVPLMALTADRPTEHQGIGAPQTTFQDGFYSRHTKGYLGIGAADDPGAQEQLAELEQLAGLATRGKPGPIHVNIGFREPLWQATPHLQPVGRTRPMVAEADNLDELPELPRVRRGLVIIGPVQEAHPQAAAATQAVADLAGRLGWPVLADIASNLRQDPGNAGVLVNHYDLLLRSSSARAALQPEFVLHIGRMPTSKTLFSWMQELEDQGTRVWHLGSDGQAHTLAKNPKVFKTSWSRLGAYCHAAGNQPPTESSWMTPWRRAEKAAQEVVAEQTRDVGLWEGAIAFTASRLSRDSRLVLASGMTVRDVDSYATTLAPGSECLVNRGVNGIDGLIATAAGVAAADRSRRVRLVLGDLAFQHDLSSLVLAADLPNLDIVVINNGGGGIFEFLPIRKTTDKFEQFFLAPQRLNISAVTASFGVASRRCESIDELTLMLSDSRPGCRVTEVMVDRENNVTMHRQIGSAAIARLNKEFSLEQIDGEGRADTDGDLEPGQRISGH
ncbi:MAG: 2-succinyl-5-enolpyruvyl-6-hydroxy-3-cyclohexene-1-carboxylic-acid synthase [Gammaproteobacteria bacterium]|nr:2-succinyl-5-enolpyruvyl-6-hydroxy-3-cyclohexene-1-carboxylic-acid synthase [Gammaproteobacteria bacterium]